MSHFFKLSLEKIVAIGKQNCVQTPHAFCALYLPLMVSTADFDELATVFEATQL